MNNQRSRTNAFVKLGTFLTEFCEYAKKNEVNPIDTWFNRMDEVVRMAGHKNGWFDKENVLFALQRWGDLLTRENLETWISKYELGKNSKKSVAIIMAGNIPLVGFHDFLCVLITGNKAIVKLSDNDNTLLPFLSDFLVEVEPYLKEEIEFIDGKLADFDAVIATGSNNTARYFDYYFGNKPNIIRKNRNSIAVLKGKETKEQLQALGKDIFQYYGLGCRSVSKIFVPTGYDFDVFFKAIYNFNAIADQIKYSNNYDYNKAVYLMSDFKILDNGFLILKEDINYHSPIASLNYEHYTSEDELKRRLQSDADQLQCIVSSNFIEGEVEFGQTQIPDLDDYADGIDTVDFLLKT